jgi:outer membrane protein
MSVEKFQSILLATLTGLVLLPGSAWAEIKIGVVSVPQLLENSPQAQGAMQALQDEFAPRQREIVAKQNDLQAKEEVLRRDGAVMSEEEKRNAERDLRELQRELQRSQQEYLEDLNLRRNEELGRLQRALLQEVQNYAREAKYDLVVGEGVLYASDALNITNEVLGALEARYRKESPGN